MFIVALVLFLLIWIGGYKGRHFFRSILWVIFIFFLTSILSAMGIVPLW